MISTWHQLVDFYPDYARTTLARETVEDGYELDRLALHNCARVLFSSRWAAGSAIGDYDVDPAKVAAHPFGANLASVPERSELGQHIRRRGTGPCRLLFIGVEWVRKGGDIAVAIAQQLNDWGVAVELQIVGCDPPRPAPISFALWGFSPRAIRPPVGGCRSYCRGPISSSCRRARIAFRLLSSKLRPLDFPP